MTRKTRKQARAAKRAEAKRQLEAEALALKARASPTTQREGASLPTGWRTTPARSSKKVGSRLIRMSQRNGPVLKATDGDEIGMLSLLSSLTNM